MYEYGLHIRTCMSTDYMYIYISVQPTNTYIRGYSLHIYTCMTTDYMYIHV